MALILGEEDEEAYIMYLKKDPNEDNTFNLMPAADEE